MASEKIEKIKEIAEKECCNIVQHRSGPALVVAGPGSGKTTILAKRFVSLCQEEGCDPFRIVAVTFTNDATGQMKQKVQKVIQKFEESDVPELHISTLHSLAKGLLHKYSDRINLPPTFRVVTERLQELLLEDVRMELKSKNLKLGHYKKKYIKRFEASKAYIPDLDKIAQIPSNREFATQEQFNECYSSLLRYYGSVNWYEVVELAVKLLQGNEDIRSEVASEIEHLLVDEYHDLNQADHELIRLLATEAKSLMVFGDDDQSIYQTLRFAHPGGVKNFKSIYPNAEIYPLSVCWRCGSSILNAAWELIDVDKSRMPERMSKKKPIPNPDGGRGEFGIEPLISEREEIQTLLRELKKELNSDQSPKDILVLFHTKEIGRRYVETISSNGLNIKNLLGRPPSDAVLLLCEMLHHQDDESDNLAARFLLENFFRQNSSWIAERRRASQKQGISLWQSMIKNVDTPQEILSWSKKSEKWLQMGNVVEILTELTLAAKINDDPAIKKIVKWSSEQESITIHKIIDGLEREFDFEKQESEETEEGCVKAMTMHRAKGMDADVVFVPALEDELMPNQFNEPEQRRLLYVSMTRAKRRLLLSWAWSRRGSHRGCRTAPTGRNRSRFLEDIS